MRLPKSWQEYIDQLGIDVVIPEFQAAATAPQSARPESPWFDQRKRNMAPRRGDFFPWPAMEWAVPEFRPPPPQPIRDSLRAVIRTMTHSEGPEVIRADGRALCAECQRPFRDHPRDEVNISAIDGEPYLYVACDGTRIKT